MDENTRPWYTIDEMNAWADKYQNEQWHKAAIRLGEELSSVGPVGYYEMDARQWLNWAMEQSPRGKNSLPQRTWVGLNEQDFSAINQSCLTKLQAATSAESILKEKNQ